MPFSTSAHLLLKKKFSDDRPFLVHVDHLSVNFATSNVVPHAAITTKFISVILPSLGCLANFTAIVAAE